jgi:hypothetical protein
MSGFAPRTARRVAGLTCVALACAGLTLVAQSADRVDYDAVYRIKDEGMQRSQVMEIASYLTDIHGPRLTGSPTYTAGAAWAEAKFAEWGLVNVRREPFEFGRGWTNEHTAVHVVEPQRYPIIAYPQAWTPGTNGPVTAEVVLGIVESESDMEKLKGQLKGKIVLSQRPRDLKAQFEPPGRRLTDKELDDMAAVEDPARAAEARRRIMPPGTPMDFRAMMALRQKRARFFADEGVVAVLDMGTKGDGGTVFVQGGGSRNPKDPVGPLMMTVAAEHYGRIYRTIEKKIPVKIELDVRNTFHDADLNSFNIVAEIPGIDPKLAAEVVMLGGHFDTWHAGTGATDNSAGSAVMMEAIRIIKAAGLKPRRTIRIALWGGEEQGLLGSRAYVKEHFADRETMALKPEHGKVSAYFNVDNGTGAIRGVYLQGNEALAPIFRTWMEPFHSLGMTTLTPRNTSGTDHLAFDAVGMPGFQFIQDQVEYDTRTHHSNMDVYERLQPFDMMKNAVIVASFVYHTANRDQLLPRKPLPKPQPATQGRPAFPTSM